MDRAQLLRRMLKQVDPSARSDGLKETLESRTAATEGPTLDVRRVNPVHLEVEMALESLDVLHRGDEIDAEQQFVLEAIVMPYHRPVVDVVDDYIKADQLTNKWRKLGDEERRPWICERVRSIGRINVPNLPSLPYAGTGFIVGEDLLMTNRHVAAIFAQGLGSRHLQFQLGQSAAIDFYHENGKSISESLNVERVLMIHPWWDMALLKVQGLPPDRRPLTLSTADPTSLQDREVVVVGYPGYDPNGDEEFQRVQNRIFRGTYYVKRLQPGLFRVREQVESYTRMVDAITHDCSTLGGNSGSAVIDLQSGHVVGLHFAGVYLQANYGVSPFDLAQDSRVVDAGVNFDGSIQARGDFYGTIWSETDGIESPPDVGSLKPGPTTQSPSPIGNPAVLVPTLPIKNAGTTTSWTIPLQISVSFGDPPLVSLSAAPASGFATEVARLPQQLVALAKESFLRFSVASLGATSFDWKTALALALSSRLSYDAGSTVRDTALNIWELRTCEFIEADDTQCFIASSADAVVVAFRGTESLGDWLSNLNTIGTTRSYGRVHRGFLGAFQVVDSQLRSTLSQLAPRSVLLTGHSLGGALATIAAAEWQGQIPISWIYTYGQPAVGSGAFRSFINQHYDGKFVRFVNDDDIVPRVPPTYRHVGSLYHFDAAGNLKNRAGIPGESVTGRLLPRAESVEGPPMLSEIEFDRLRAQLLERRALSRASGLESLEGPVLEGILPSVSDHSLDRYIAKIAIHGKS